MFESLIKRLRSCCTLQVRITDDQLDDEDWGIEEIKIDNDVVVSQKTVSKGAYRMPHMVGWTSEQVIEWTNYENPFGAHPQQFNEVFRTYLCP